MAKTSAGLLVYRYRQDNLEVFLVHPGGPFWAKKDAGSWSIAKGEFDIGDDPLTVAKREFQEETSFSIEGDFKPLEQLKQPSGKIVHAWAIAGDFDSNAVKSNTFSMEWPPKSGKRQDFPEVDRAGWFTVAEARKKILKGQIGFLEQLEKLLAYTSQEKSTGQADSENPTKKSEPGQTSLFS